MKKLKYNPLSAAAILIAIMAATFFGTEVTADPEAPEKTGADAVGFWTGEVNKAPKLKKNEAENPIAKTQRNRRISQLPAPLQYYAKNLDKLKPEDAEAHKAKIECFEAGVILELNDLSDKNDLKAAGDLFYQGPITNHNKKGEAARCKQFEDVGSVLVKYQKLVDKYSPVEA